MFKTAFRKAAVAAALIGGVGAAVASPTLTNTQGSFANFGGFDWASNGTAVVDSFNSFAASNTFNLTFWARASSIVDLNGVGIDNANLGLILPSGGGGYEYTLRVLLNETSTCTVFSGLLCTTATFNVNFGSFDIWYDTSKNSNQITGAGITDGALLISGSISAQNGGGFNVLTGGNSTLQGAVTFTNNSFINPSLAGTTATSTLQIGANQTGWAAPTSLPGAAGGTTPLPAGALTFQADANQDFTVQRIPEPGTLALAGLALTALGFGAARRRKA